MKNNLLEILKNRGVLSNVTSEEKFLEILSDKPVAYVGFDPTSDSLHLGNYVQVNISNLIRKFGVEVIPVIGGATGSIGDPSGKSSERNLLSNDELKSNVKSISIQLKKIYGSDIKIINNFDFYSSMSFLDFLRDVGKNFSINYMLEKESIKNRLESGISYTEFSYLVLQAYDFYYLNLNQKVNIQIGGSDQYGNITSGLELIRKKNSDTKAVGLTFNLLTNSSGKKFGKSEKGAIFLSKNKTSVYQMYQYFLNIADEDLKKMFCFLTCLDISEIDNIMQKHLQSPRDRLGQKELSKILISTIHSYND
jgi:tyrosyl-tRNA synthetase